MEGQKKPWESENPDAVRDAVQGSGLFTGNAPTPSAEERPTASVVPPKTSPTPPPAAPSEQSKAVVVAPPAQPTQPTPAQRFANAVEREFTANNGVSIQLTNFQRKIIQSYFIKIDMVLAEAERKRLAKSEKYRDAVPVKWENVNMPQLAVNVIAFSAIGLDPAQPNHINPIPFKNNNTGKYDITFVMDSKAANTASMCRMM